MSTQHSNELPLFQLIHSQRNVPASEPNCDLRHTPKWKYRCQLLLRYLQSHDLNQMPEALHQRLYVVLTEIVRVLGDNLSEKLPQQDRKWSETDYDLEQAATSFLCRDSFIGKPYISSQIRPFVLNYDNVTSKDISRSLVEAYTQTSSDMNQSRQEQRSPEQWICLLELKNKQILEKQNELAQLRNLYRQAILDTEKFMFEQYTVKEKLNIELQQLKQYVQEKDLKSLQNQQEISKLQGLLNEKDIHMLTRINSDSFRPDLLKSYFGFNEQNFDEQTLTIHSMSRPQMESKYGTPNELIVGKYKVKVSTRRPSMSITSGDQADFTAFETQEGSEDSVRNHSKLALMQKRLEQLESDLKIKDEVIGAINSFIEKQGEAIAGEKHCLTEILKRCELKEKVLKAIIQYKSYCSLAEQNAYLKKCMDKLTRSQQFWSKLQDRQELLEDQKKCIIF